MYRVSAEARIPGLPCDVSELTGDDRADSRFGDRLDGKRERQWDRGHRVFHEEPIRAMNPSFGLRQTDLVIGRPLAAQAIVLCGHLTKLKRGRASDRQDVQNM
jgi:hypothetical protein